MTKVALSRTRIPRQRNDGAKDERFTDSNVRRALPRVRKAGAVSVFDPAVVRLLGV